MPYSEPPLDDADDRLIGATARVAQARRGLRELDALILTGLDRWLIEAHPYPDLTARVRAARRRHLRRMMGT